VVFSTRSHCSNTLTNRIAVFSVLLTIYVVVVVSMDPATPSNTINTHRSWFSAGSEIKTLKIVLSLHKRNKFKYLK